MLYVGVGTPYLMIKKKDLLISGLYGAVDLAVEKFDTGVPVVGPVTMTDLERTAAFIGGIVVAKMSKSSKSQDAGNTVAVASLPLFEKSIYNWAKSYIPTLPRSEPRLVLRQYEGQTLPPMSNMVRTATF